MMQKVVNGLGFLNFGLAILAAILFFFDAHVNVPEFLTIAGRSHPMLLHLPIGMFAVFLLVHFFKSNFKSAEDVDKIIEFLLLITCFFAFTTAISGSLLSHEPDSYNISELTWHRNTGFGFAFGVYLLSFLYGKSSMITGFLLLANVGLIIIAGHKGAEITHGKGFLFAEKDQKESITSDSNMTIFASLVEPILEKKCFSCHSIEKSKGGLIMTDSTSIMKGGDSGPVIIAGHADSSLMIKSILLPLEDEKHMPPDGKPQISNEEKEVLIAWINSGASFSKKANDFRLEEAIKVIFDSRFGAKKQKIYHFSFVDEKQLAKMNTHFMSVKPLYNGSPALKASMFLASEYSPKHLKTLLSAKEQVVQLNLTDIPLNNADLNTISELKSLEKLLLNGTKVTDDGISQLKTLQNLEILSLSNTDISQKIESAFTQLKSLKELFIADTKISEEVIYQWQKKYPAIKFYTSSAASEKIKLSAPILVNQSHIIGSDEPIVLKHYIKNAVVRYTTDGSEPDSVTGQIFDKPFTISGSTDLKVIAIKDGWYSSDVMTYSLFEKGATPDSCILLTEANPTYQGHGALTFLNGQRGPIANLKDPNWIAFRENTFAAIFQYDKPIALNKISFCYGLHIPQYVFPPISLSVFGSNDLKQFKLITKQNLLPFKKETRDQVKSDVIHMKIKDVPYKYYKIESQNLPVIPQWHPGKGERGWLFIDEIFFYN